jgi:hypothetical protein
LYLLLRMVMNCLLVVVGVFLSVSGDLLRLAPTPSGRSNVAMCDYTAHR